MKANALRVGMPLNEFWYGNPQNFYLYCDEYKKRMELQQELADIQAYNQGVYSLLALRQSLGESFAKYAKKVFPEEPFSQTEKRRNSGIAKNALQEKILKGLERQAEIIRNKKRK